MIVKITSERRQSLDRQWSFSFGASHGLPFVPKAQGTPVDLPHDYSIIQERDPKAPGGDSVGFFPGGVATYEKTVSVPDSLKGKRLLLEFEGVYMNAAVFCNDSLVVRQPYGYTTFHCDVTPYVHYGRENRISVVVNNAAQPNSRWYSGSGIYRHVRLHVLDEVHISPWGVFVSTPSVSPDSSTVSIQTTVDNTGEKRAEVKVRCTLLDASGNAVAEEITDIDVSPCSSTEAAQELAVDSPTLWSVDSPYLYSLKSEVVQNGDIVDERTIRIGIRSISFDAKNGFRLNGVSMKLKGGCVHADNGPLGAACYDRAEERKIELLKASGFNAVRCVHNPPSPAFLDACDRLGMLVIDEAFDCWREGKSDHDYSLYFDDWWQRDLSAMIRRDRNHPSIIMWSIGNEIREITGTSDGYAWARRLADFVRSLDDTRAVTSALQEFYLIDEFKGGGFDFALDEEIWNEHSSKFTEAIDVVGINYGRFHYDMDGKNFPDRVIVGGETYPQLAYDYWSDVERLPYVIGDFVWTAVDYLGEVGLGRVLYGPQTGFLGEYPWLHSNCGDIDICGFKRPQSYYRDCVWGIADAPYLAVYNPEHHGKTPTLTLWAWQDVAPSWSWPGHDGKPTVVDVYSRDEEVELILNGRSLGRKPAGKANRYTASFEVVYEAGTIVAVGYSDGHERSRASLQTAGAPDAIRLTPDRKTLDAGYGDLCFVTVEMLDAAGVRVPHADHNIRFTVEGPGTLLAVGSSDPKTEEMYTGNQRRLYNGRALAVIRSDGAPGEIVLTAEADGVSASRLVIRAETGIH
jgi:beta-galactosidase